MVQDFVNPQYEVLCGCVCVVFGGSPFGRFLKGNRREGTILVCALCVEGTLFTLCSSNWSTNQSVAEWGVVGSIWV